MTPDAARPAAAIIAAGGIGRRMGGLRPKQFMELAGMPVLAHALRAFEAAVSVRDIILVAPADHREETETLAVRFGSGKVRAVVAGGVLRQDSVRRGLEAVAGDIELVAVHDGARPLVPPPLIEDCLAAAWRHGAAIAAVPVRDTLKRGVGAFVADTVDRENLWQAQTPQAARIELLREACRQATEQGFVGTDEAALFERLGVPVALVQGAERNIKITGPEDLVMAEAILGCGGVDMGRIACRIGHGYDAHRLVDGRPLVLGGVAVPFERGLAGHSDADVLTHALCDAILGALGAGDLGRHFPDNDPAYAGISSLRLLSQIMAMVSQQGYVLGNADVTVVAQRPRLAGYFPAMREGLAAAGGFSSGIVSLKATTTEGMGFAGREEGIAAHAVVMLVRSG